MSEPATQFDLHPGQTKPWEDQLPDGVSDVFDGTPRGVEDR
ncbi:hypothetical protein [Roseovarius sp. SYSU LYC5161]